MNELKKSSAKFQKNLGKSTEHANKKMLRKLKHAERQKLLNRFTGNVDRKNGVKEFWDGTGVVGGANEWVQTHRKRHHQ